MRLRFSHVVLAASLALVAQPVAIAQSPARGNSATLATPLGKAKSAPLNGVMWHCDGDACVGAADGSRPLAACARVARAFGPVTRFATSAGALGAEELARCNAQA